MNRPKLGTESAQNAVEVAAVAEDVQILEAILRKRGPLEGRLKPFRDACRRSLLHRQSTFGCHLGQRRAMVEDVVSKAYHIVR